MLYESLIFVLSSYLEVIIFALLYFIERIWCERRHIVWKLCLLDIFGFIWLVPYIINIQVVTITFGSGDIHCCSGFEYKINIMLCCECRWKWKIPNNLLAFKLIKYVVIQYDQKISLMISMRTKHSENTFDILKTLLV